MLGLFKIAFFFSLVASLSYADITSRVLEKSNTEPAFEEIDHYRASLDVNTFGHVFEKLVEKYPSYLESVDWFGVHRVSTIKAENNYYFRVVAEYEYENIETMHGSPSQEFIVWITTKEKIAAIHVGESFWPM